MTSITNSSWLSLGTVSLFFVVVFGACKGGNDIGDPCGTDPTPITDMPIGGETPVVEVVRMERDGACESFKCLRNRGLPPFCTRSCKLPSASDKNKVCEVNAADAARRCNAPTYCLVEDGAAEGRCVDDDCPDGFWCRQVQETGPLSGEAYCVRREHCSDNFDCENLGSIECATLGCFDRCLNDPTCTFSELVCQRQEQLPCGCENDISSLNCFDEQLICE
ncbi:MAG: hypothetical protein R3C68_14805, partial [Myxococcota bacterium]